MTFAWTGLAGQPHICGRPASPSLRNRSSLQKQLHLIRQTKDQALHAPPVFDGQHVIVGSWLVGDEPAGIALREDTGRITRNTSRFVPHFIRD